MQICSPVQKEDRYHSTGNRKDKRSTKKQKIKHRRGAGIVGKKEEEEEEEEIHGRKEKWIMPGVMEEESTGACSSSTAGSDSDNTDIQSSRFEVICLNDVEVCCVP